MDREKSPGSWEPQISPPRCPKSEAPPKRFFSRLYLSVLGLYLYSVISKKLIRLSDLEHIQSSQLESGERVG